MFCFVGVIFNSDVIVCMLCVVGIYEKDNECVSCDLGNIVKEGEIFCMLCVVGSYV